MEAWVDSTASMDLSKTALWVVAKAVAQVVATKVLTSNLERALLAEDLVVVVNHSVAATRKVKREMAVMVVEAALEVRVWEVLVASVLPASVDQTRASEA